MLKWTLGHYYSVPSHQPVVPTLPPEVHGSAVGRAEDPEPRHGNTGVLTCFLTSPVHSPASPKRAQVVSLGTIASRPRARPHTSEALVLQAKHFFRSLLTRVPSEILI